MTPDDDARHDDQMLDIIAQVMHSGEAAPTSLANRTSARVLRAAHEGRPSAGERITIGVVVLCVAAYGQSAGVVVAATIVALLYARGLPRIAQHV